MAFVKGLWLAHGRPLGKRHLLPDTGHYPLPQDILQAYRGGSELVAFSRDAGRKTNVLAVSEASLKRGESVVVRERAVASLPSSASQRSSVSASQRSPSSAIPRYGVAGWLDPLGF